MSIFDQLPPDLLAQLNGSSGAGPVQGADGNYYYPQVSMGGSNGDVGTLTGYTGYSADEIGRNTSQPGDAVAQYGAGGGLNGFGAYSPDSSNITFGDFATGAMFVGGAAAGFGGAFGGLGAGAAAEGGGGTMDFSSLFSFDDAGLSSDIGSLGSDFGAGGDLGGGMNMSDFSFGSDGSDLMSSLGSSLSGAGPNLTGFSKLLPLISQIMGGQAAQRSGNTANSLAQQLINRADPFAPYRAGYGQKLQDLEASHDVTSIPGYQAGLDAVQRAGASQGFTGSGNMMKALQDYGGNFFNQEASRLAGLAGANVTPGNGFATAAGLIGAGQMQSAGGQQMLLSGLAGVLGPGNPVSDFMSQLGSPALTGNPLPTTGGLPASQIAG